MLLKENQETPLRLRTSYSNTPFDIVMIETQQQRHHHDAPATTPRQMAVEPESLVFHQRSHLNDDDSCSSFSSSSYYEMEELEANKVDNAPLRETKRYEFVLPISFSSERRRKAPKPPTRHHPSIMDADDYCISDFDECEDSILLARRHRGKSDEDSLHLTRKRGVRRIQRKVSNEGQSEGEINDHFDISSYLHRSAYSSIESDRDYFVQLDIEIDLPADE